MRQTINETIYEIVVILIALMLIGCTPDEKVENGCECELVTTETYVEVNNGVYTTATRVIDRQPYINDCDLDGLVLATGQPKQVVKCK